MERAGTTPLVTTDLERDVVQLFEHHTDGDQSAQGAVVETRHARGPWPGPRRRGLRVAFRRSRRESVAFGTMSAIGLALEFMNQRPIDDAI